jgi:flagellar biosynthesis regulator FlbT|tara:strand:+ start:213 stop:386 length:174 start_codon:yes stop_codon:yes gene_type:complete
MVTNRGEALHLVGVVLRYMDRKKALHMLCDMDFEVAETTENESLKDSIKMVRRYLEE